jgi:hypothetical protein
MWEILFAFLVAGVPFASTIMGIFYLAHSWEKNQSEAVERGWLEDV